MEKKLVAALACRNNGSRLYGKPLQNLDVDKGIRIIDNIIDHLSLIDCIDEIILAISEGVDNEVFKNVAREKEISYVVGDEKDVLYRLIDSGRSSGATDIFRVTSESPFLYYEPVEEVWENHKINKLDASFYDEIIDGCGFEIISQKALETSHAEGSAKHRSELCSLYIREHKEDFNIAFLKPKDKLIRRDLRLTVDNPEDLIVCRKLYQEFRADAPRFSVDKLVEYLDGKPFLKKILAPYTETGYKTMYIN